MLVPRCQAKLRPTDSAEMVRLLGTGGSFRIEWLFAVRCAVLLRLWLRALAFEVRVPSSRLAVVPCILPAPALVPTLGLDLLPDNRVVLCADKGIAPPLGWAK